MTSGTTLTSDHVAPLESPARVLVAEQLPLLRHAVATLLDNEADFTVVATAGGGIETIDLVQRHGPDLLVLGIDLVGMNGLEVAKVVRERHPATRIVMVTEHREDDLLVAAIRNGADGYLLKDMDPRDLFAALRSAMRGQSPISPCLVSQLMQELRHTVRPMTLPLQRATPENSLSRRELEILGLAARGLSNKQIAQKLSITEGTVKNHVHNSLHKLGMTNRIQAANFVVRRGLVD